ncbi:MAG: diphosphomevalonate decarboxylase [Anaerolineales bacterium]|nr:diphosphomevalonate decarboxylase [Anaerolineales bacterium]
MLKATAVASPNIALIKYWGNRDATLRLPSNGSISMTLGGLTTETSVTFNADFQRDEFFLNGEPIFGDALNRVSNHLDYIRRLAGIDTSAIVESRNNFPIGVGIASSASGFSALTVAASAAAGLDLSQQELSRLSRLGSGSACRSIYGGYVEWHRGEGDEDSFATPLAKANHWNLVDIIVVIHKEHKATGSTQGHLLAETSPLQDPRVEDADRRLDVCRSAILSKDFHRLATVVEQDSNMMHAVMMTSSPPLLYIRPETIAVMKKITDLRSKGLEVCYTIDAGPNVHCICTPSFEQEVTSEFSNLQGVIDIIRAIPGPDASIIEVEATDPQE